MNGRALPACQGCMLELGAFALVHAKAGFFMPHGYEYVLTLFRRKRGAGPHGPGRPGGGQRDHGALRVGGRTPGGGRTPAAGC